MKKFAFNRAETLEDAVSAGASAGVRFIAGGTNLIDLMKENVERPDRLVDITRLPLGEVKRQADGSLSLGALVSNAAVAEHPLVRGHYPLLSLALLSGASPQLRNLATVGGNLLQRTRCCYFYDLATVCNKRTPQTGCAARNGINRQHAILGHSQACIAVHPSDMCVALAALEARVRVLGRQGERTIPIADFHRLPGNEPEFDTILRAGDLITAVELPSNDWSEHSHYLKIRDRASYAFALVSVAVALQLDGEYIVEARLALGGVAHKPWRLESAELALRGQRTSNSSYQRAAETLLQGAEGFEHNRFKIELARRAIVRACAEAAKGTRR
ncbi:xanthine dehydrogenase family protein subunit M [bacterium]|nr:xanthine dehydrogenase family protein subunit M [bacterium]